MFCFQSDIWVIAAMQMLTETLFIAWRFSVYCGEPLVFFHPGFCLGVFFLPKKRGACQTPPRGAPWATVSDPAEPAKFDINDGGTPKPKPISGEGLISSLPDI